MYYEVKKSYRCLLSKGEAKILLFAIIDEGKNLPLAFASSRGCWEFVPRLACTSTGSRSAC